MQLLDVVTIAVLGFLGVRVFGGLRFTVGPGRAHVVEILHGLRPRHFLLAPAALFCLIVAVVVLLQIPGMSFGWWTAIGGLGNPVTGTTDRTAGTPLAWIVPAVFLTMLVPALPLFAEAEERRFRLGSEHRTFWGRVGKGVQFGLFHAIIGIPIGVALALSVGGWYFTWAYLRGYERSGGDPWAGVAESTRAHLAYNAEVVLLVALILVTGSA
jgi:hypothetical protein